MLVVRWASQQRKEDTEAFLPACTHGEARLVYRLTRLWRIVRTKRRRARSLSPCLVLVVCRCCVCGTDWVLLNPLQTEENEGCIRVKRQRRRQGLVFSCCSSLTLFTCLRYLASWRAFADTACTTGYRDNRRRLDVRQVQPDAPGVQEKVGLDR